MALTMLHATARRTGAAVAHGWSGWVNVAATTGRSSSAAVLRSATVGGVTPSPAVRTMGIFDRMQGALEERKVAQLEQQTNARFKAQVDYLLSVPHFTLQNYMTILQDNAKSAGLTGWRSSLRSTEKQQEMLRQYPDLIISEHLKPEEMKDHSLIRGAQKARIAQDAGVSLDKVTTFVKNFESLRFMHNYLHTRKSRGLPIPNTQEEYVSLMGQSRAGMSSKDVRKTMPRVRGLKSMLRQR